MGRLQHLPVQTQLRYQLLQPPILVFQLYTEVGFSKHGHDAYLGLWVPAMLVLRPRARVKLIVQADCAGLVRRCSSPQRLRCYVDGNLFVA